MADQISVIDLVEAEFDCKEVDHYQDKIAKLEEKVIKMEQKVDGIMEMIDDLKNSSNEDSVGYNLNDLSD